MKYLTALAGMLLVFALAGQAQNNAINKVRSLYEDEKYEKCIEKADDFLSEDRSLKELYVFKGLAHFALYEQNDELRELNDALREISLAEESYESYKTVYSDELSRLHKVCKATGDKYFNDDKQKISEKYYQYLAQIYKDTTEQYLDLFVYANRPDGEIVKQMHEGKLNQTDKQGYKQGPWKKVHPNGVVAYEVTFKDNKPQGAMIRRHPNGNLMAELVFSQNGEYADAKLYNEDGELIAKGFYKNQEKDSLWQYYKKDFLVQTERYKNGQLHGTMEAFYPNGQVYDKRHFTNGAENGLWAKYYQNGNVMLKGMVKDNKLEGVFIRYFPNGSTEEKGQYKNDKKTGIWDFYTAEGKKHSIKYVNGVAENADEQEIKQSEQYEQEIQNRLKDPENFKNNPNDYIDQ